MNQQNSSSSEFPFVYLHNEMVKYFQEKDDYVIKQRQTWLEKLNQSSSSDVSELLMGDRGKFFTGQIFAQRNSVTRLESIGYRVGFVLAERLSRDMPRFSNELDKVKFICKEFWASTFGKGVDKLSTNHQGIYIIQDNRFYTLAHFSEGTQYINKCVPYMAMPAGIVRGALDCLGVPATVTIQIEKLPVVRFNIQLTKT